MIKGRILIVEDEAIIARDLEDLLQELGYEVVGSAATGARAVELALVSRPDLVLMDIRLEGEMDGIEAATLIRERIGSPVVFLTAYADDVTLERAKAAEPYGYLVKPIAERELNSTVQVACHRRRVERERVEPERLQRVLEDLGGGYYRLDPHGRFVEVSPTAEDLFGRPPQELIGRCMWELFPELDDSAIGEKLRHAAATGADVFLETFHLPARLRVRMYAHPHSGGLSVYYFATETS